jgi:hypothetical protein
MQKRQRIYKEYNQRGLKRVVNAHNSACTKENRYKAIFEENSLKENDMFIFSNDDHRKENKQGII